MTPSHLMALFSATLFLIFTPLHCMKIDTFFITSKTLQGYVNFKIAYPSPSIFIPVKSQLYDKKY